MKSGFGFLIEIHPEDRFLGGKICFRISKSKSGFPIKCNLRYICQQYTVNYLITLSSRRNNKVIFAVKDYIRKNIWG